MPADKPNYNISKITGSLPDAALAERFFSQLYEKKPAEANKLLKNSGLLSDVLTLAAFSPLLGQTILQTPAYISWLSRQRKKTQLRDKTELLESLGRFALTNSIVEPQVLLARFRRRELLRIYLRDIRRLDTIVETTEEISNLADAVLEYALRFARQELDNRYGIPLEIDEKGRSKNARFCIVSLGKLGSNELNYSSDIDLLFLYSSEGTTSGQGARGTVTNREYFVKLAEYVTKIVGQQTGEGAAYRVDLRLRPHGRVGALAVSISEAVNYYRNSAQAWERQTLIRARASAGDTEIFKDFFAEIESSVYSKQETVARALLNVKLSKDKINLEHGGGQGFNVKLGRGGIREIEFIAQALQLAHGGKDPWLRASHTLISLARLAERNLLSKSELTDLFNAYEFLRCLEHRLQMEHGLQTHLVPEAAEKRLLVAKRMNFPDIESFDAQMEFHLINVSEIFSRVFGNIEGKIESSTLKRHSRKNAFSSFSDHRNRQKPEAFKNNSLLPETPVQTANQTPEAAQQNQLLKRILESAEKSDTEISISPEKISALKRICETSNYFGEMIFANPRLIDGLPSESAELEPRNYEEILRSSIAEQTTFREEIAALRIAWTKLFLEIATFDIFGKIDVSLAKRLQTELAEASLRVGLEISETEMFRRYPQAEQSPTGQPQIPFAALGLGKLGGRGMDYGSDLDLVLIYDDEKTLDFDVSPGVFYSRFVELFVTTLSSFTREGNLYRVDLRLRPDGRNGTTSLGKGAFLNYLENRSAIWEWLAYVKLRGVSGDVPLALRIENEARQIIHKNALKADQDELRAETLRIRRLLEEQKTRGSKEVNIKFGAGGLLDIYFTVRYLQLRDDVHDAQENRVTQFTLRRLYENQSLSQEHFTAFSEGHKFLSRLDHNLRLTVGRSNVPPLANKTALQIIAARMNLESVNTLMEQLTLHRMEIRQAFENILG